MSMSMTMTMSMTMAVSGSVRSFCPLGTSGCGSFAEKLVEARTTGRIRVADQSPAVRRPHNRNCDTIHHGDWNLCVHV